MEFRVLGKLEVVRDGVQIDLGAFRQRALLGLLLTAPNTVFSTDRLIDLLWGDGAGPDKQSSLWVYVSGIRKALEPGRAKRSDGTVLLTRTPGYLVEVDPADVDAARFERLMAEGRSLVQPDPAAASLVLGEALASWRGRAFEDFTYESWAQSEIARLEGLRLEAVELRIDADLRRGMSRALVSELEALVRQHPLREHMTGQLMVALFRSGRQADALRAFRRLRARLGEELGIEPSSALRRLEEQIVTGDPGLGHDAPTTVHVDGPHPGLAVRGYELRERLGTSGSGAVHRAFQPSVGREVAIEVIRPEIANDPDFIRRFDATAQLIARLEHPHVVPLYDYWREPDAAYLVTRLMRGGRLADLIEHSALDAGQAALLVEQVGGAIGAAHRVGIVHGHLTPASILIDDGGNAYLSGFPIAIDAAHLVVDPAGSAGGGAVATGFDPALDVRGLATVLAQALTGLTGEIAQVRGALDATVRRVVDRAVDPGTPSPSIDRFVVDVRAALGDDEIATGPAEMDNPYKGLRAFGGADAADFHGRELLVDRLLARLGEPGARGRFLAVVGPSGSGKSSVVRAGLLPAIRGGALPLSGDWFIVETNPAPHPFEQLEEALLGVAGHSSVSLIEMLTDFHGLRRAVERVVPTDGAQLVVVIDQFEELFTQVDEATCARFIEAVVDAVRDDHARIRVVVTLRADFYDRPLRHRSLGELLRDGTEVITPMTPAELERAITGPIAGSGVSFERSLVADLVHDVVDRPGALPLLQYTLTELFDGRDGPLITHASYAALGGISGALITRAEGLHCGLGEDAGEVARQMFLRLVTLGEGTDDTRRRVLRTELEQLPVDRRLLDRVLDTYARHRLLTIDRDPITRGPIVEISHEALLREWTRLRRWIDSARSDVRNQRRLAEAMAEWVAAGRTDDYLLRGGRLEQLNGWASTTSLPLSEPERTFLDAGVAERGRVERETHEHERRAVDAERRARRRVRQLVAVGVVAALVGVMAIYSVLQRRAATEANAERDRLLQAIDISAASVGLLERDPELALLLAVEAVASTVDLGFATEEAVDAVHWALYELGVTYDIVDRDTAVAVRSGPDGLTGVWVIPPAELVGFAMEQVERRLTDAECERYVAGRCSPAGALPVDLPLRRADRYGAVPNSIQALAGTSVAVSGPRAPDGRSSGSSLQNEIELAHFERESRIDVSYSPITWPPTGTVTDLVYRERQDGDVVAVLPREMPVLADRAIDLRSYLDVDGLRADFSSYLVEYASVAADGSWPAPDGAVLGIPVEIDVKGLVVYSPLAFETAGYAVPETLDALVDLSRRMVADGRSPWCFGFRPDTLAPGSDLGGGGPGTDVLESLVLRIAGPTVYDDWARHRIPFDDRPIREAAILFERLVFEPGFVAGGSGSIASTGHTGGVHSVAPGAGTEPTCWMHHQEASLLQLVDPSVDIGRELGFFVLPPAAPGEAAPVTGSVTYLVPIADRPEVRRFMQRIAGSAFGRERATSAPVGSFFSPNISFREVFYEIGDQPQGARDLYGELGRTVREALVEGRFRIDASDTMPVEIGSHARKRSAFFDGMIDVVDGERTIEQALADIEVAWTQLEVGVPD